MKRYFKGFISMMTAVMLAVCCILPVSAATNGNEVRVSQIDFIGEVSAVSAQVFVRNAGTPVECCLLLVSYNPDKSMKEAKITKGSNGILEAGPVDAAGEGVTLRAFVWKTGDMSPLAETGDVDFTSDFDTILRGLTITFDGVPFNDYIGSAFAPETVTYTKTADENFSYPDIRVKSGNNAVKANIVNDEANKKSIITVSYGLTKAKKDYTNESGNAFHTVYEADHSRSYTINYANTEAAEGKLSNADFTVGTLAQGEETQAEVWYQMHYDATDGAITTVNPYVDTWPAGTFAVITPDDKSAALSDVFVKNDGSEITDADVQTISGQTVIKGLAMCTRGNTPLWYAGTLRVTDTENGINGSPTSYGNLNLENLSYIDSSASELNGGWVFLLDNYSYDTSTWTPLVFKVKKPVTVNIISKKDSLNRSILTIKKEYGGADFSKKDVATGFMKFKKGTAFSAVTAGYMLANHLLSADDLSYGVGSGMYYTNKANLYGIDCNVTACSNGSVAVTVDGVTQTIGDLLGQTAFASQADAIKWAQAIAAKISNRSHTLSGKIVTNILKDNTILEQETLGGIKPRMFEYSPLRTAGPANNSGSYLYGPWNDRDYSDGWNYIADYPSVLNLYGAEHLSETVEQANGLFGTLNDVILSFAVNKDAEVLIFKRNNFIKSYLDYVPEGQKEGWSDLGYYTADGKATGKTLGDTIYAAGAAAGSKGAIGVLYDPGKLYQYVLSAAKEFNAGETVNIYGNGAQKEDLFIIVKPISK